MFVHNVVSILLVQDHHNSWVQTLTETVETDIARFRTLQVHECVTANSVQKSIHTRDSWKPPWEHIQHMRSLLQAQSQSIYRNFEAACSAHSM